MRAFAFKSTRALLAVVLALTGLAVGASTAAAANVTIGLCATTGTATLTGATTVPIWGFGIPVTPGDCSTATAGLPGPVLTVNQGDVVSLSVTNALPAGHALQIEIPGVTFDPGPVDGSAAITFMAGAPGTYMYQSGGDAGRQEAMGLYGALVVRPTSVPDVPIAGQAYGAATTAFDTEATLVLSQVDPSFNANPDTFNMYDYLATAWLINGKSYPDTAPITAAAGQRVLVRYLNAGFDNTSMVLLGMHERVVARDASLLNNPMDADAETLPSGATEDVIAIVPAGAPPSANGFPIYNRQLHVTNGTGPSSAFPGGMLTFITPVP